MRRWSGILTLAALAALGLSPAWAAEKVKETSTFGVLTPPTETSVRVQAYNWLKEQGKAAEARQAFDAIWAANETPVLDKLAATFALGSPEAKKLLDEAADFNAAAPTELPAVLKDAASPAFFRANLALAYAKGLSNRKVYEEALETLRLFKADQVVDPSSFLFHKAVAEHALMIKKDANETIARLLDDVPSAPERYKMVAALMHFDMVTWQDKDLGAIGRKMDIIQRRLDLARGGKKTQKIQREVVMRLDEIIKELENQQNNGGS